MNLPKSCMALPLRAIPLSAPADETEQARGLASRMVQQLGSALKKELASGRPWRAGLDNPHDRASPQKNDE